MSATTTQTPQDRRDAAIAEYTARLAAVEDARSRNDGPALLKASGRLGTPVQQIRAAEADMAEDGIEFDEWTKPLTARASKRQDIGTAAEVKARIAKLVKLAEESEKTRPQVAKTLSKRVAALQKAAADRGMKV